MFDGTTGLAHIQKALEELKSRESSEANARKKQEQGLNGFDLLFTMAEVAPAQGDPAEGKQDDEEKDLPVEERDCGNEVEEIDEQALPKVDRTEEEERIVELQQILLMKGKTGLITVQGKDADQVKELLERVKKEMNGQANKEKPGHPIFGEATRELFAAYKSYLETKGVRGVMQQLSTMQLGTPSRSPEELRLVNQYGRMLPEQPIDFVIRMRKGDTDYKLKTLKDGKMEEVDTTKIPSRDALDRILGAESFMKWAQDEIIFDRKVRLQEDRLAKRIANEGWPKEWLDHPLRANDRYGWCMAVIKRMEDSRHVGRTVEAIFHLRTKNGLQDFGQEAIKNIPDHVKVELYMKDGSVKSLSEIKNDAAALREVKSVKTVKLDHPLDLDLNDPDFKPKRLAEVAWMRGNAPEVFKLMQKYEMASKDPRYYIYQGDIETKNMACLVDKKTGEVFCTFKKSDFDTEEKRTKLYPSGKTAKDYDVVDFNIIRCRMAAQKENDPKTGQLKYIAVDYSMQYGNTPLAHTAYAGLWVDPVGNPARPKVDEHSDGLQRFEPKEWVVARADNGEESPMMAQDLEMYAEFQDFKRIGHLIVSATMDASMLIGGVGTIVKGVQVLKGAHAAYQALSGCQKAMALVRAGASLEGAGMKMILKGGFEAFLGIAGLYSNEKFQEYRGYYFLAHAVIGMPGISRLVSGGKKLLGLGKDARLLSEAVQLGKFKPGPLLSAMEGTSDFGFRWSNRAFGGMLIHHLWKQQEFIDSIGKPDGFKIAQDRLRGVKVPEKPLTPQEKWDQANNYLKAVEHTLEDYLKNQDVKNKEDVQKILDKTKKLLEPPPKELLEAGKEKELKEFREKRATEIAAFKKELRDSYLLFDGQRVSDAEKQRAEKYPVYSEFSFERLKDDPIIVAATGLHKDKWEAAQKALKDQEDEYKKAGKPKDDAERAEREEKIGTLKLQMQFAKDKYEEEVIKAAQQLRKLETEDKTIDGANPKRKFEGKEDVQKAAALAYLLLSVDDKFKLPADGVLHREEITVPGWTVTKEWTESHGEHTVTVKRDLPMPERKIVQQLTINDLTSFLSRDLTADNPNARRISTAEVMDRLAIIQPEEHASVLKRIILDPSAKPEDKKRAIANLSAVISQIEIEEARRAQVALEERMKGAGDRFTNRSEDLKKVLDQAARNTKEDKDVRAFASYQTWVLSRKEHFEKQDLEFLKKVMERKPPGLTCDEYLDYMMPVAGLKRGDKEPPALDKNDKSGWDRRLRALQALEQMIDPLTGKPPAGDFNFKDINRAIVGCLDSARPEQAVEVLEVLMQTVKHDGVPRMRLNQIDKEDPLLATKAREMITEILGKSIELTTKDPNGNEQTNFKAIAARAKIIEMVPALFKEDFVDPSQKARVAELRAEAARIIKAVLYATEEKEIRSLRLQIREAEAGKKNVDVLKARLRVAEREFGEINGCKVKPDTGEIEDLYKKLFAAKDAKEKAAIRTQLEEAYQKEANTLIGESETNSGGKAKPDLSSLNMAGFQDQDLRKAAIRALSELNCSDKDTLRILTERATPPAGLDDPNTRVESIPEVRLAALNALAKVMAPLDYSRLCNELALIERSPGNATKLRAHTWYSDIGLDPQSMHYQDQVAKKRKWDEIIIPNPTELAKKLYTDSGTPYYFLNGDDLHQKIKTAIDNEYHFVSACWYTLFCGGPKRVQNDELEAIRREVKKFHESVDAVIKDASAEGKDEDTNAKRIKAQHLCYALVAGDPPSGWHRDAKKEEEHYGSGWGKAACEFNDKVLKDMRLKAARALAEACQPGMDGRDYAGKLVYEAIQQKNIDYQVKLELLKGLNNLAKPKLGPEGKVEEKDQIVFEPWMATDKIMAVLGSSLSEESSDSWKFSFEMECVRYIRRNVTFDSMRQSNLFADLEAKGSLTGCRPAVRHALWELIADRRDRVLPIWGQAKADQVTAEPKVRAELLTEALQEVAPSGIAGVEGYDAPLIPKVDPSEMEARIPSAVQKIAMACKGPPFEKDDPRVPMLQELMKRERAAGGYKDERVRLAAALAILKQTTDPKLHEEAIKVLIEVAVDGYRPGARFDAQDLLKALKGDDRLAAEKLLQAHKPETMSSNKLPFPEADMRMKEAAQLGLLGQLQALMGKDKEAEVNLRAAFNLYRGKPKDAPLHEGENKYLTYTELQDGFGKYKDDRRLREVSAAIIALGEVHQKLKLDGSYLRGYGEGLQFNLGWNHPEVTKTNIKTGEECLRLANLPEQETTRFYLLWDAKKQLIRAWNAMAGGSYASSAWDRVGVLDKMGDAYLQLSDLEHPQVFGIGSPPPDYGTKEYDLSQALWAYNKSLELKERYKMPPPELAEAHFNLARVYEQYAKQEPGKAKEHKAKAEEELNKALLIARENKEKYPVALADQLIHAAQFYKKRGDEARAQAFNKEAMAIYEKHVGSGSLNGKSDDDIEKMRTEFAKQLGDQHPMVAKLNVDIAEHYLAKGQLDKAEKYVQNALSIYKVKAPDNDADLIRALNMRHGILIRLGKDRYPDCIETFEWLKTLLEKDAKGEMTPQLSKCLKNLRNCLQARAEKAVDERRFADAVADAEKLIQCDKQMNGGKVSDEGRNTAMYLKKKPDADAVKLLKEGKLVEAGPSVLAGMDIRLAAFEGKMPEVAARDYTGIANIYEKKIADALEKFKKTGEWTDIEKEMRIWIEIHKRLNGGVLSKDMADRLGSVNKYISDKLNDDVLPRPLPYKAEAFKKAEPALRCLVIAQQERLVALKELSRTNPEDQKLKEQVDDQADALAGRSRELNIHYLQQKEFQKSEQLCAQTIAALHRAAPDGLPAADALAQLIETYSKQGKKAPLLGALERHMKMMLETGTTEDAVNITSALIRYFSSIEGRQKMPGLTVDVAEHCLKCINDHIAKLPADKQSEFVLEAAPRLAFAIELSRENLKEFLESEDGGKLSDDEKAEVKSSIEKLTELINKINDSAEQPWLARVKKWQSEFLGKQGEDDPRFCTEFQSLVEAYAKAGKFDKVISLAESHLLKVLEKGTADQIAASFEAAISALGDKPPEEVAHTAASIVAIYNEHLEKLPEDKRNELAARVGPRLRLSFEMLKLAPKFALENDPPTEEAKKESLKRAIKTIETAQGKLAEIAMPALKKRVEAWSSAPGKDDLSCPELRPLIELLCSSGKTDQSREIAERYLEGVLKNGTADQFGQALQDVASAFGFENIESIRELMIKANKLVETHAAALGGKKDAFLAAVGPILMKELTSLADSYKHRDNGEEKARELDALLKKVAKAAQEPLKKQMTDALSKDDIDAYRKAFIDLGSAYVIASDTKEASDLVESFVKEMGKKGKTEEALSSLSSFYEKFMRDGKVRADVSAAVSQALKNITSTVTDMKDGDDKTKLLWSLVTQYHSLAKYAGEEEAKQFKERAKALQKLIPVPTGSQ